MLRETPRRFDRARSLEEDIDAHGLCDHGSIRADGKEALFDGKGHLFRGLDNLVAFLGGLRAGDGTAKVNVGECAAADSGGHQRLVMETASHRSRPNDPHRNRFREASQPPAQVRQEASPCLSYNTGPLEHSSSARASSIERL